MWASLGVALCGWFVASLGAGTNLQFHQAYVSNEQSKTTDHTPVTPAPVSLERIKEVLVNIEFELGELKAYLFGSTLTGSVQLKPNVVHSNGESEIPHVGPQTVEYSKGSDWLVTRGGHVSLEHNPSLVSSDDPDEEEYVDDVLIFS
ncbi:uncharacterized protein LOC118461965 [Anopheles albimanus]|uniref:uncharacterized protein LOC118461965 n=1 Tax=Anopheles albimanus TaxID=7167 RepID=UPI00163FCFC5|nr:uncharacterized protein LOC118461965 [Anopheles albimanus]